ncbi:DUF5004 domain-containing protein [Hymenobacter sp. BT730]|uniref:DUF5004 domain-containing protein n=1 Tax=Hymenobacter sp. BT730 TaxID=3063332 RepID=UPI0026DF3591|nr:DUF5004 domain-containing protein [Hymenobacter sp. BT730]
MNKLPLFLSLALGLTTLASCEKETVEVENPAQNKAAAAATSLTASLPGAAWHLTDMTSSVVLPGNNQVSTTSMFARLKPSLRDNQIQYQDGGQYLENEGQLKQDEDAPQQSTGTWKLNEKGDSLTITIGQGARSYAVAELTATSLRLRSTQNVSGGASVTTTSVFSR